ncbi:MAG: PIG-L family deacetylase [Chloroflexota bacterium]|nr:PIG-L family deacetylase [Chloroflexota bacterium]
MKFKNSNAEIYVPSDLDVDAALGRTTHLAVGAHQDDLEIMAASGILECFQQKDKWFTGVVMTDGRGSPRAELYAHYSDEQMMEIRVLEQKKAAQIGDYSAQVFLGYPSSAVKEGNNADPVVDLENLLRAASPNVIYTHNLADKHQTHVGVAVRVVQAIRKIPTDMRPKRLYGCEVWRSLDWVMDAEKIALDCSERTNIQNALLSVFDSQVSGGKRYDLATMGRRLANATFFASHAIEDTKGLTYAMDLTPLIQDDDLDIKTYVQGFIDRFAEDVSAMINKM